MPRRRRSRTRSRKERTEWIGAIGVTPTVIAAGTLARVNLLSQAALEEWPGGRIERILGQYFISPATGPAGASGYGVFVGLTFSELSAGPTTSQYDPETEPEHSWLRWWSFFPQIGGTGVSDQNVSRWIGYFRMDVDVRLRRRFGEDRQFDLMVKNSTASAAGIQISYAFRILIAAGAK